ncbi:Voltage-dependent T-type calcium channel subunit alpha-1G [Liparis tanakae]|uniref:Voltage-dependent T-type calcium channel subunit alpha-1G n=1 Tax=Liparis tanakae TaxID=230148 RepID=A0A4Z2H509_9TELE|nr:Voltage-dependent T-type calcium channel subunit alpha-1G [Liparis tanakae]
MAEDGGHLSGIPGARGSEGRSSLLRTFIRLNDLSGVGTGGAERGDATAAAAAEAATEPAAPTAPATDGISTTGDEASASGDESLPYPTMAPVVFLYLKQSTRPRSWCLKMVCNPYPFHVTLREESAHAHTPPTCSSTRVPRGSAEEAIVILSKSGVPKAFHFPVPTRTPCDMLLIATGDRTAFWETKEIPREDGNKVVEEKKEKEKKNKNVHYCQTQNSS